MAHEFHLPDIGEGLAEAVVVSWYVDVGDVVGADEPLVEIETDKAVVDIPSPYAGVLLHRGAGEGETIAVEQLLAVVGDPGEEWRPVRSEKASRPPDEAAAAAPIVGTLAESAGGSVEGEAGVRALPRVRRLAAELAVDLSDITGTGRMGRITEGDVHKAAAGRGAERGPVERVPMSPTRRTIAEHLSRSWREIPQVTTYGEAPAEPMLARRRAAGSPPLEALLIQAVAPLLERFPLFNASLEGSEIVLKRFYDIGVAIDAPDGLLVGVVRDAGNLNLDEISAEIVRLAEVARNRTIARGDLIGQTFTISNIGAVGGRYGTPIVPLGTTAILSVGRAEDKPVVRGGEIVVGREFPLSLSFDHRVIDGADGRAFLGALIEALESS